METPIWEQAKENSAPLERGRNVALLEQSTTATDEERRQLERMVRHYEKLVQQDVDDPLVHWLSYIKFHQESFPVDTHEQFLLLERCFRALCPMRKYANDLRFIRVCCRYAEQTKRPREIFQYLYQQNIGTQVAIFWAAWAFVAEKEQDYAFCDKIFNKGLTKQAAPLNYLQQRYKQFQRRMSRHWLNSTNQQDDDEEDEDENGRRGVLGGLSEDSVRRNDRRTTRPSTTLRNPRMPANTATFAMRNSSARPTLQAQDENQPFAIYTEETPQELAALNDSLVEPDGRVLEREEDRLKENTIMPERWNERGALSTSRVTSTTPIICAPPQPVAFAVYVDEECAAQHEREQAEKRRATERHRQVRDDRTFKERGVDSVAERLTNDPLRYVRDPSQVQSDQPVRPASSSQIKSRGFDKSLLKSLSGVEQCFEEARIQASYYKLVSSQSNVNLFAKQKELNDSNMSMDESTTASFHSTSMQTICAASAVAPKTDTTTLSLQNQSFDPNVTAESTTSSVAVGDREAVSHRVISDPTINTQLALKELSMMFSSPAFPLTERSRMEDRSGGLGPILNESGVSESCNTSVIILQQDEFLAQCDPDSSLIVDNHVPKEPCAGFAIFTDVPSEEPSNGLTTVASIPPSLKKEPSKASAGFEIFTDDSPENESAPLPSKPAPAFEIFTDIPDGTQESSKEPSKVSAGLEIFTDSTVRTEQISKGALGFEIYSDQTHKPNDEDDTSNESNSCNEDEEGDTATFSLLNEVVQILDDVSIGDERDEHGDKNFNKTTLTEMDGPSLFRDAKISTDLNADYAKVYKDSVQSAIRCFKGNSVSHFPAQPELTGILAQNNVIYDLQEHALPRPLKRQQMAPGVEITVHHSSAKVVAELGRGSFGIVALLKSDESETIAVKSQAPVDCLAHEFDLLRKAKDRIGKRRLFFPDPLSLVFFADGALLTMSAVSKSGLNLIDLVNIYTLRDESVPEILVLFYTSIMLSYIETLHWKAKILHCDVKPDNWVLSRSDRAPGECMIGSDLCLIDFGRGIDLNEGPSSSVKEEVVMDKRFVGPACVKEMMCVAMRKGLPWSFDADTFGICACVHVLLFSCHIHLMEDKSGEWIPRESFKGLKYASYWDELFRTLLNANPETQVAIGSRPHSLRQLRNKIEKEWSDRSMLQRELERQASLLPSERVQAK